MANKKIVVDTNRQRGQLFRVSESGGRFHVYDYEGPMGFDKSIGEACSLEDAIQLIKAYSGGSIRKIEDW